MPDVLQPSPSCSLALMTLAELSPSPDADPSSSVRPPRAGTPKLSLPTRRSSLYLLASPGIEGQSGSDDLPLKLGLDSPPPPPKVDRPPSPAASLASAYRFPHRRSHSSPPFQALSDLSKEEPNNGPASAPLAWEGPMARPAAPREAALRLEGLWELGESEASYVQDLEQLLEIHLHQLSLHPAFQALRQSFIAQHALDLLVLHRRILFQQIIPALQDEGVPSPAFRRAQDWEAIDAAVVRATQRIADSMANESHALRSTYSGYCAEHARFVFLVRQEEGSSRWLAFERRCALLSELRRRSSLLDLLALSSEQDAMSVEPTRQSIAPSQPSGRQLAPILIPPASSPDPLPSQRSPSSPLPTPIFRARSKANHRRQLSASRSISEELGISPEPSSVDGPWPLSTLDCSHSYTSASSENGARSRLRLRDLLIKPIQRICLYPLVLANLLNAQPIPAFIPPFTPPPSPPSSTSVHEILQDLQDLVPSSTSRHSSPPDSPASSPSTPNFPSSTTASRVRHSLVFSLESMRAVAADVNAATLPCPAAVFFPPTSPTLASSVPPSSIQHTSFFSRSPTRLRTHSALPSVPVPPSPAPTVGPASPPRRMPLLLRRSTGAAEIGLGLDVELELRENVEKEGVHVARRESWSRSVGAKLWRRRTIAGQSEQF